MISKALTVAGSDSGGGAGIQADLKTFSAFGVYGLSVITALTAQNTLGVKRAQGLAPDFVKCQLDAVLSDIGAQAVKTGMLFSRAIAEQVASSLFEWRCERLVVDPVMIAKGGSPLVDEEGVAAIREKLIPLAFLVTPNIPEAEALSGMAIQREEDRLTAARKIRDLGCRNVLIKGGHWHGDADDLLFDGEKARHFSSPRQETKNTHGTGCTLSAAITAGLAQGWPLDESVARAKRFVSRGIARAFDIGAGHGPLNHFVSWEEE